MRAWLVGLSLIGLSATAAASCVVDPYVPSTSSDGSGGAGGAASAGGGNQGGGNQGGGVSMSSSSSGGPTSSSSGSDGCTSESDCQKLPVTICHKPTCDVGSHTCVATPISTNSEKQDAVGDCADWYCENGQLKSAATPDDAPPANPYSCAGLTCDKIPAPPAQCFLPYKGGTGTCVPGGGAGDAPTCSACNPSDLNPCDLGSTCVPDVGKCVSTLCAAGTVTTTTDFGCGGPSCPPCEINKLCHVDSDCKTHNCDEASGKCIEPSCDNGKWDGFEANQDCGGQCAKKCEDGSICRNASDCASNHCYGGTCKAPTCFDNIQNNGEAGKDCGGPCAYVCP